MQAQIKAAAATAAAESAAVQKSCTESIETLKSELKAQKEAAEEAAASEVEVAASWLFLKNPIHPTNRRETVAVEVVGKNFQQYDFSPAAAPYFKCIFALATDAEKVHTTSYGKTFGEEAIGGPSFVVHCPSPASIKTKTVFQLALEWVGADEVVKIPFKGAENQNLIT